MPNGSPTGLFSESIWPRAVPAGLGEPRECHEPEEKTLIICLPPRGLSICAPGSPGAKVPGLPLQGGPLRISYRKPSKTKRTHTPRGSVLGPEPREGRRPWTLNQEALEVRAARTPRRTRPLEGASS